MTKAKWLRLKQSAGVVLIDTPAFVAGLWRSDSRYLTLCNRGERLIGTKDGTGYKCDWQWTSDLHVTQHFPFLGRKLIQRALRAHPITRSQEQRTNGNPQVTFIIGHRGESRLPHLLNTVATIAAQVDVVAECIVVEQDSKSVLSGRLPSWVKFVHSVPPTSDMPYCRSWAFNVGARLASAEVLVLHDNDMLIPQDYAKNIHKRVTEGAEVLNLKRFIFYCTERHTAAIFEKTADLADIAPETVVQNLEGGGSVAITREAFERIGGMDESFIGWGGEDNEFWERAQTCRVWPYGYLPLVHLWHPSQPKKQEVDNPTLARSLLLSAIPAGERISRLRTISRGANSGPAGYGVVCLDHGSADHDALEVRA